MFDAHNNNNDNNHPLVTSTPKLTDYDLKAIHAQHAEKNILEL